MEKNALGQDVAGGAPAEMDWEWVDVLLHIGLKEYLDADRVGILPIKGCKVCTKTKTVVAITACCMYNERDCSWGSLQQLQLKTGVVLPSSCNLGKLVYSRRLNKLY